MYKKKQFTCSLFSVIVYFSLLIFFSLFSCRGFTHLASSDGLELDVMTFNIRYGSANDGVNNWNNRSEMVFDIFRNYNPDIVGLQEALDFQITEIRKGTRNYGRIGVGREDGKTEGEYSAILYRLDRFEVDESGTFWFSDTQEVPGSTHWGNACVRICTWARFTEKISGQAFYVFNLHLDHVSQSSREKSVGLLTERIGQRKHKDPFIVTGDFNAGENNPAILYMKGSVAFGEGEKSKIPHPMVDTFRVIHPDVKGVGTFNEFKGIREGDKIDFIFATPDVKVLDAKIIYDNTNGRYPSDHFPVTATIEIR
jgi:endonuclease/exonuclease/phosphatase family metal-dependent hydrolase